MKRKLRHPIRSITEPYGKAGLLVAILALVLATTGAAFAAAGLSGKQKKEVEKIAKKFAGKNGANGAPGERGPAGPTGESGTAGKNGTNGKSVVTSSFTGTGGTCTEGGATVEQEGNAASKKYVCNGAPWTAGGTLPKGQTEKGTWFVPIAEFFGSKKGTGTISFGIPLSTAPTPVYLGPGAAHTEGTGDLTSGSAVVKNLTTASGQFAIGETISGTGIPAGTTIIKVLGATELDLSNPASASGTGVALTADLPAACSGSFAEPLAEEGTLCIYARSEGFALFHEAEPLGKVGAQVSFNEGLAAGTTATGTWAVTAG